MKTITTSDRLKEIISEGMKQTEILERVNRVCKQYNESPIGKGALSQYVNGKVAPKQNRIYVLAKALNVNEAWLMGYDVERGREEKENASTPAENSTVTVTPEEEQLINGYRGLNRAMQDKLRAILEILRG